jgi:indolepyruvate ferredoxin oxidoreductase
LYGSAEFKASLEAQFSETPKMSLWLSPPLISRIDAATGRPKKYKFGPWILRAFALLARARRLRGTRLDPFGYTEERRSERRLIEDYVTMVASLGETLDAASLDRATELAALPLELRGYGPVKAAAIAEYERKKAELLAVPKKTIQIRRTGT